MPDDAQQRPQSRHPQADARGDRAGPPSRTDSQPHSSDERPQPSSATDDTDSSDESETDQTQFLVGLEYDGRAERRRVEYRLENWDGTVTQLPRMSRIVEGGDFYALYEELQDTVDDPGHLSVYELDDLTPSSDEQTVRVDRVFDVELDRLEWATHSLLDKRSATQVDGTTYEVHPDASDTRVALEYHLMDVQQGARLELSLTGPTPAPNAVKDAILRDLGYLLPEPEEVFDS